MKCVSLDRPKEGCLLCPCSSTVVLSVTFLMFTVLLEEKSVEGFAVCVQSRSSSFLKQTRMHHVLQLSTAARIQASCLVDLSWHYELRTQTVNTHESITNIGFV